MERTGMLLGDLGLPPQLRNNMACYTLIAMADLVHCETWRDATNRFVGINMIIQYLQEYQIHTYAPNTRESIRKQVIKPWRDLAMVEDNGEPTNSGKMAYRLTDEFLQLIQTYESPEWITALKYFRIYHQALIRGHAAEKHVANMNVRINGQDYRLSPGAHNKLQKAVAEVFKERFARDAVIVYLGDSVDRVLYKNQELLDELGFDITLDVLPDIVMFDRQKRWLYFIECVTSVGPINDYRKSIFDEMTRGVDAGNIYVTAFPDAKTFKKFAGDLAWDTEVWIADLPEHMIHLNGDRFIGPR